MGIEVDPKQLIFLLIAVAVIGCLFVFYPTFQSMIGVNSL